MSSTSQALRKGVRKGVLIQSQLSTTAVSEDARDSLAPVPSLDWAGTNNNRCQGQDWIIIAQTLTKNEVNMQ